MGFLDKVNKRVGQLKDTVEQLRPQEVAAPATEPQSVAEGADLADRRWWPTAADVTAIAGVPMAEPEHFETAESFGNRYMGTDAQGRFIFDLHMVNEQPMLAAGGARGWIDARAAAFPQRHQVDFADYSVAASESESRQLFYSGIGDALFYVDARSPGVDVSKAAERIMRKLYDLPE